MVQPFGHFQWSLKRQIPDYIEKELNNLKFEQELYALKVGDESIQKLNSLSPPLKIHWREQKTDALEKENSSFERIEYLKEINNLNNSPW